MKSAGLLYKSVNEHQTNQELVCSHYKLLIAQCLLFLLSQRKLLDGKEDREIAQVTLLFLDKKSERFTVDPKPSARL